ncbi:MAG: GNAT family N-acetyltransferase [Alphaproteobacteria bacterium]|nr:GNAT family N-acetyltransferase [Alphaproteobacteria bacterium]
MISLRPSNINELETFDEMDRQEHARKFVNQTGIETHQKYFSDPKVSYLSIENSRGEFCGYFILVLEAVSGSVEFRRILIDQGQRGIGQAAIAEMEIYCKNLLGAKRIWLDVYEDNDIGMHIYEKMGYARFKEELAGERKLFFYDKAL